MMNHSEQDEIDFRQLFQELTGNSPFSWQVALYQEFIAGDFRSVCDLPTGLGKTSIITIWLLAMVKVPKSVPRRLVYVVNRRTVVDQSTDEAVRLRAKITGCKELLKELQKIAGAEAEDPLAISSLRGQFADNREWLDNPARPAIVIGTVDMIGSRLLFSGYGCRFKSKPTHAGLLGQETLLVHDEAHLEPAFQELLESIEKQQHQDNDRGKIRVMQLTATSRSNANSSKSKRENQTKPFQLSQTDYDDDIVKQRMTARKGIDFHPIEEAKKIPEIVSKKAMELAASSESGQAILIFLRRVKDVEDVVTSLKKSSKNGENVETLTGTLRGWERDELAKSNPVFARFLAKPSRPDGVKPAEGTVFLVCTSAGEVGVNISANHLVCDLSSYDSMAQRFGRVNRFGETDARIVVVHEEEIESNKSDYEQSRLNTLQLLKKLPQREDKLHDASPKTLGDLPDELRDAAFSPMPEILHVDDILFDAWSLTTIWEELPGRPPVADWLHGVSDNKLPDTHIAWREEVKKITGEKWLEIYPPEELLKDYPLKQHELLRDNSKRIFEHLKKLAKKHKDEPVWIIDPQSNIDPPRTLGDLVSAREKEKAIEHSTVLLPPCVGGLSNGLFDGSAPFNGELSDYDISQRWCNENGSPRRKREWIKENEDVTGIEDMREVRSIDLSLETDEDEQSQQKIWRWYVRLHQGEDDLTWQSKTEQLLEDHLNSAQQYATKIVNALTLEEPLRFAVVLAAKYHDLGKARLKWQNGIGNNQYPKKVLAKSKYSRRPNHRYRHEFGSLIDIQNEPDFLKLAEPMQELVLHLIAAHHGRGRPHFPSVEAFDPERSDAESNKLAADVPRRFARLQKQYGRWGLAWLESLVRAADVLASKSNEVKR